MPYDRLLMNPKLHNVGLGASIYVMVERFLLFGGP